MVTLPLPLTLPLGVFMPLVIPTGSKIFAEINLPFTTKQYKNDNFVYYGKTRM